MVVFQEVTEMIAKGKMGTPPLMVKPCVNGTTVRE
jgi:hypothetical protein